MEIYIDNREKAIKDDYFTDAMNAKDLSKYNITTIRLRMTTADFAICYRGKILALVERKTWKDLAATIKDGKRKFNYKKMIKLMKDAPTCMRVIYLIEGRFLINRQGRVQRVPYSTLRSHLDHLMYRHDIHCVYSRNKSDTAHRILELAKNIANMSEVIKNIDNIVDEEESESESDSSDSESDSNGKIKGGNTARALLTRKIAVKKDTIITDMLKSVSGITRLLACVLIKNNIDIKKLMDGSYEYNDLKLMKYPSGRSVPKSAINKIITNCEAVGKSDSNKSACDAQKLLSSIPGISMNISKTILTKYNIVELLQKSQKEISGIKLKKRKVGPAIAKKIKHYFDF